MPQRGQGTGEVLSVAQPQTVVVVILVTVLLRVSRNLPTSVYGSPGVGQRVSIEYGIIGEG